MELLTFDGYSARKVELSRARELAQADYEHEVFRKSTGAGDTVKVGKAKDHLAAISQQIDELEIEWRIASAKADEIRRGEIDAEFASMLSDVDDLLEVRRKAAAATEKALDEAFAAIREYDEAGAEITRRSQKYHVGGLGHDNIVHSLFMALSSESGTASTVFTTKLYEAGKRLYIESTPATYFGPEGPEGFEKQLATRVRSTLGRLKPKHEDS